MYIIFFKYDSMIQAMIQKENTLQFRSLLMKRNIYYFKKFITAPNKKI